MLDLAETDTSATDYITTPPLSPANRIDESFRRISIDEGVQSIRRSSEDGGRIFGPSGSSLNHLRRSSADSAYPAHLKSSGPLAGPSSFKVPRTPSGSASPSLSLSAKKTRISPGTLDLSALPRFPPLSPSSDPVALPAASATGTGAKTPQALTNGLFGSGSGSTPRALFPPIRPGLTSRWSTDSSDSSDRDAGSTSVSPNTELQPQLGPQAEDGDSDSGASSSASEECEHCEDRRAETGRPTQGAFPGAIDAAEDADGEEDDEVPSSSQRRRSSLLRSLSSATVTAQEDDGSPSSFGNHFRPSPSINPYFSPSTAFTDEPILSPLPPTASFVPVLLPPAPKPHQMGFSPFVEAPSPREIQLLPSQVAEPVPPQLEDRHCKKCRRAAARKARLAALSPASSPAADARLFVNPPSRLTRSQGLRIRDEGSSRPKGRYARALSAQLHGSAPQGGSSTMKTASALLDGTISPAATTSDPLRVKLRELPGARTPDSQPPSPSPLSGPAYAQSSSMLSPRSALASYSLTAPPKVARTTSSSSSGRKSSTSSSSNSGGGGASGAHKKSSWLSPAQASDRRPSSPLHISTLAGESDEEAVASAAVDPFEAIKGRRIDTRHDVFSRSFSFAHEKAQCSSSTSHQPYIRSPLASPRSNMPTISEGPLEPAQSLNKVNPYFAGFI